MSDIIQLISASDFEAYKYIPATLPDKLLAQCIERAQHSELRDLLGRALYKQLLDNRETEPYLSLLKGGTMEVDGQTVDYYGIVPYLVWTAYRYLITDTRVQLTNSGPKLKNAAESKNPDSELVREEVQYCQAQAAQWASEVLEYINANSADFPEFRGSASQARGSFSISMVVQPRFSSGK